MALTFDTDNRIVESDSSITDIVSFHSQLRDFEDSPEGMILPITHTYKEVDVGGGAIFPSVQFVNGWRLKFPTGNFEISGGNLKAEVVPVAGSFIERTQSLAYAVTSAGGTGYTPEQIAIAVKDLLLSEPSIALESTAQKAAKQASLAAALSA